MLHQFLGFDPIRGDGQGVCAVEGSVLRLSRLHAWATLVVQCLAERETHGKDRQKLYADSYWAMFCLAIEQLIRNSRAFPKSWEPHNLTVASGRGTTNLLQVLSGCQKYTNSDSRGFADFISLKLGKIHDWFKTKTEKDSSVFFAGTPTIELASTLDDKQKSE